MRILLLTFVFIVSVTATARARLGETADQLAARYGQPLSEIDQKAEGGKLPLALVTFQKNGFQINATLSDGVSVSESFKKVNGEALTLGEVRTLLTDNSEGSGWEAPLVIDQQKKWTRDDGAEALLTGNRILTITTKDFLVAKATAKKLEQAPSLDGF
ncbi:MAG: hypothetical protein LV480_06225 [Methylacidiphilales bacterium]|nr:hypothetical protein [Candidatus Methylacidiphilales bacterium]